MLTLTGTGSVGDFVDVVLQLVSTIIIVVINQMVKVDKGYGVKWQWRLFTIPGRIFSE